MSMRPVLNPNPRRGHSNEWAAPNGIKWDMSNYNEPPTEFYYYIERSRFAVWAETSPGLWFLIKHTNNMDSAYTSLEFWDERVNVKLIDAERVPNTIKQGVSIEQRWAHLFWRIKNDPTYGTAA